MSVMMGSEVASTVSELDPVRDPRWLRFLRTQPMASMFHTPVWLEALRRTYAYEPVVFTTSGPSEEVANGLVFCRVESWLTGPRLVSLPFTDHCQPLVDRVENLRTLISSLEEAARLAKWKYVELRPLNWGLPNVDAGTDLAAFKTYCIHGLDLRPGLDELFKGFHKSCVQRKIQRAEREGLSYEAGRSKSLLAEFYYLLRLTRRRHRLPPQPRAWFRNLIECLGDSMVIRVASRKGEPIASILTLTYKNTIVYKYGCSDARFHNLGGMPFLFWRTVQEAKKQGLEEFDLGRSELDDSGLLAFKDHLGATRSMLVYYRYPASIPQRSINGWKMRLARHLFARMPDPILTAAGKLLYKHIG